MDFVILDIIKCANLHKVYKIVLLDLKKLFIMGIILKNCKCIFVYSMNILRFAKFKEFACVCKSVRFHYNNSSTTINILGEPRFLPFKKNTTKIPNFFFDAKLKY